MINWTDLIADDKCDNPDRSDAEVEQNQTNAIKNAPYRQISDPQGESRLVIFERQGRPSPRTEESVQLFLAKKIAAQKRSKEHLQEI